MTEIEEPQNPASAAIRPVGTSRWSAGRLWLVAIVCSAELVVVAVVGGAGVGVLLGSPLVMATVAGTAVWLVLRKRRTPPTPGDRRRSAIGRWIR